MTMAVERREQQQQESRKAILKELLKELLNELLQNCQTSQIPKVCLSLTVQEIYQYVAPFPMSQLLISHQSHNHCLFKTVSQNYPNLWFYSQSITKSPNCQRFSLHQEESQRFSTFESQFSTNPKTGGRSHSLPSPHIWRWVNLKQGKSITEVVAPSWRAGAIEGNSL